MMSQQVKPKYLWFRMSIAVGLTLGLLLLIQTVATYRYVARSLVRQEAQREAERRVLSIGRAARLSGAHDSAATLSPVLHELVHEAPAQIAWIRVLNLDGNVIAESEKAGGWSNYEPGALRKLLTANERPASERLTESGRVLVMLRPIPFGTPPFARPPDVPAPQTGVPAPRRHGGRPPLEIAEVAVYLDGVSTHFGLLRENLIVGTTAAFAVLGAVIVMGLRFRNYMRGKHMEEELSLARRVQNDLFPDEDSPQENLAFAARCVPAYQVGGDLYDVFQTEDGQVGLVLGDVSGKGLAAALLMGVVQGAVRASCGTNTASDHARATERLNHLLCVKTARERFVSLFWCYFDPRQGLLRYVNAGHLPPLLVRRNGSRQQITRLSEGGPVLGLLPNARYRQAELAVESGDLLVVYSDGILEAANAADEEFGEERVIAAVERNASKPPDTICAAILDDVRAFLGKELPQDDQTLLVARLDRLALASGPATRAALAGAPLDNSSRNLEK
jgi:hypothetical protein